MTELARGSYAYWRDGELQNIREPWCLVRNADGLLLRGERWVNDRLMLSVEARYEDSLCISMQLIWLPDEATGAHSISYLHRGDHLEWTEAQRTQTLPLPTGSLLYPLLRAATGPLLTALGTERTVVVPCLHNPQDAAAFLQPLLSQRQATKSGANQYRYRGGEYGDAGCECWLHPQGFLQRYVWPSSQGAWKVELGSYIAHADFLHWPIATTGQRVRV